MFSCWTFIIHSTFFWCSGANTNMPVKKARNVSICVRWGEPIAACVCVCVCVHRRNEIGKRPSCEIHVHEHARACGVCMRVFLFVCVVCARPHALTHMCSFICAKVPYARVRQHQLPFSFTKGRVCCDPSSSMPPRLLRS